MLPAFATIPTLSRTALAALLALGMALPAAPAFALNEKERGIVAGALGVLVIQGLAKNAQAQQHAPAYVVPMPHKPAPVYAPVHQPRPVAQSIYRTPAAYAFSSYSHSERRAIQRSLARAGYYYGPVDGDFGPGTYNATVHYARDSHSGAAIQSQAGAYGVYDQLLYAHR